MDRTHALEIITLLADGVDPSTGEVLPRDNLLQHPDIVRALFFAKAALRIANVDDQPNSPKDSKLPAQAGKPWSGAEDQQLISRFDSGTSEKELASKHQRTVGSIRSRLIKLGKLELPYKK